MFPKEIRNRFQKGVPYSPETSPHKSQLTVNDSNMCSFDEITVEKQRAMSHKKLSIVSSSYKNQGMPVKAELTNLDMNRFYRNTSKNNLMMGCKKSICEEKDKKFSLKSPSYISFNNNRKQAPKFQNSQNKPQFNDPNKNYIIQHLHKISMHFQKQISMQADLIRNLSQKIQEQEKQLKNKESQIAKLLENNQIVSQNNVIYLNRIKDLEVRVRIREEDFGTRQKDLNDRVQKVQEILEKMGMSKIKRLEQKVGVWMDQSLKRISRVEQIESYRFKKIEQMKDNLELIDGLVSKMEEVCTKQSIEGSNWQQLSDFIPNFGTNSRLNNFSSLSFASQDYFFHPKNLPVKQPLKQSLASIPSLSSSSAYQPQKFSQSNLDSNLKKIIRILQIYDDILPCIIDSKKRILNMLTNQYLVDQKGKQLYIDNKQQIQYLVQCGYLRVLKRFDEKDIEGYVHNY